MKTNRNFWRVLVLALALVMMFAIVACSNDKDDAAATTEGAADTTAAPTTEKATKATKDPNATTEPKTTVTTEATTEPVPVIGDNLLVPNNGINYIFYKALPEVFVTEEAASTEATTEAATGETTEPVEEKIVIEIAAADYDKDNSVGVKSEGSDELAYYYLGADEAATTDAAATTEAAEPAEAVITWKVTIEKAAYYDFALQMRLNDAEKHGATILVDGEELCKLEYQFKDTEYPQLVDDAATQNTWVAAVGAGFGKNLTEGAHTISIKGLADTKSVEMRKIYLLKSDTFMLEEESSFDNDKDGKNDVFYFYNAVPELFTTKDTILIKGGEYDKDTSSEIKSLVVGNFTHYYLYFHEPKNGNPLTADQQKENEAQIINWKFKVEEDGYYEMCIQMRMKNGSERGNIVFIDGEEVCKMNFQFDNDTEVPSLWDNATDLNTWMTGFGANLKAGDHILSFKGVPTLFKTFHTRYIYLTRTGDITTPAA